MSYGKNKTRECFLGDTSVENVFIREYMAVAPETYTKVYLFGLMAAGLEEEIDDRDIEAELDLPKGTAAEAWRYWASKGVVEMEEGAPVFLSLKEFIYGNTDRKKRENRRADSHAPIPGGASPLRWDGDLKAMWEKIEKTAERAVSGTEIADVNRMIEEYDLEPAMVTVAYEEGRNKGNTDRKYVRAIILNWARNDIRTEEEAREHQAGTGKRQGEYKSVAKAMGFFRGLTAEEKRLIDSWFDDLNCTVDEVIKACDKTAAINNPNIKYVDKVIRGTREKEDAVSYNRVKEYYSRLREKAEGEAAERKDRVHEMIPEIREIDDSLIDLNTRMIHVAIDGGAGAQQEIGAIKEQTEELQEKRKKLLSAAGIPVDFENPRYRCSICKDTGVTPEGSKCRCYMERENELRAST